jgi:hypothetical protein
LCVKQLLHYESAVVKAEFFQLQSMHWYNKKSKVSLSMARRSMGAAEVQLPSFLTLAADAALPLEKNLQCPLNMLDEPQSQSGCVTEKKNNLPLQGSGPQTIQPVA